MKGIFFGILSLAMLTSCATIVGGSNYWANVMVADHPNAKIIHNGFQQGTGQAVFLAKRRDANRFSLTIKQQGCESQTINFTQRAFRGWAFVGTIITWTGLEPTTGIPLPWGILVDAATGAWWKPSESEKGVIKQDYKHFYYRVEYTGCPIKNE